MRDEIKIDLEKVNDQTAVIHLEGDLTSFAEDTIVTIYESTLNSDITKVIFHFKENDYINSSGLAVLIGIVTRARKHNQQLYMVIPSPHFQKMFRAVGLADYSTVCPSLEEAMTAVS